MFLFSRLVTPLLWRAVNPCLAFGMKILSSVMGEQGADQSVESFSMMVRTVLITSFRLADLVHSSIALLKPRPIYGRQCSHHRMRLSLSSLRCLISSSRRILHS